MIPPSTAYRRLLAAYGPQGWWPVTPPGGGDPPRGGGDPPLGGGDPPPGGRRPAYRPGRRAPLAEREALEVAVGAILTQNTAWANVERAIEGLLADGPLTVERLLRMPRRRLERLIRSSGYFRQKALKLRDFAAAVAARGGRLTRWLAGDGAVRDELLAVRGVGPETADSILLYAGGRDAFVVDAYTLRIGARAGWFPPGTRYAEARGRLSRELAALGRGPAGRARVFQEFHALLVRLAKLHCRTKPVCAGCPLDHGCKGI